MSNTAQPLLERGRAAIAEHEREHAEGVARNIAQGKSEVRRGFVFRFYHDTMIDTHLSGAYHKFGPTSPDPDIQPVTQPHSLGGGYHSVAWEFEYDGIRWMASYGYRTESWGLDFYVRRPRRLFRRPEWLIVHSPAQVVEALS